LLLVPVFQKHFISSWRPDCPLTSEHNIVLKEIIRHAKLKHRTCHISFFDLADAFGSISHDLIQLTLKRNYLPGNFIQYISLLYNNVKLSVHTSDWSSNVFSYRKGTLQGDPLSPLLFILTFHPILMALETNTRLGFDLDGTKIISLAYADDFCLITSNKRSHQKLIQEIKKWSESMGLMLKPSKCRSFSLQSGKPTNVAFLIGSNPIPSIETEDQKFLGKMLFFSGKESDKLQYLTNILQSKLDNINKVAIRNEFKLAIYKRYLLPSLRFLFTVHDLTKSSLKKLDDVADKMLKAWIGLPKCATRKIIHSSRGLSVQTLSDIYEEAHVSSLVSTFLNGDTKTAKALELKKTTELDGRSSMPALCNITSCKTNEQFPTERGRLEKIPKPLVKRCSNMILEELRNEHKDKEKEELQVYKKQGHFLSLLHEQEENATWLSFIYGLPRGTLRFILNSCIDTLPTMANLFQWSKATTDKCPHCGNRETISHVLNCCPKFLQQGRYTWRHDCILKYLTSLIDTNAYQMYADLPGMQTRTGGTIPADLVVTTDRPDLTIINKQEKTIYLYELTVPFESRIASAHNLKLQKYEPLAADLSARGWRTYTLPFEVGSRGHITKNNRLTLQSLYRLSKKLLKLGETCENISKLAITGSYKIFISRKEPTWISPDFLEP